MYTRMPKGFMQILLGKAELQFHAPTISAKSSKVEAGQEKLSRLPSDQPGLLSGRVWVMVKFDFAVIR